jgi:site-specific DNA-methyltransferase (adenine-specific)
MHPTVKPLALMRYLVKLVTPLGGVCLDPYIGSGTTAMACKLEGINYICIDNNAEYLEIAKKRIDAVEK